MQLAKELAAIVTELSNQIGPGMQHSYAFLLIPRSCAWRLIGKVPGSHQVCPALLSAALMLIYAMHLTLRTAALCVARACMDVQVEQDDWTTPRGGSYVLERWVCVWQCSLHNWMTILHT